jgi:hypothetical protein
MPRSYSIYLFIVHVSAKRSVEIALGATQEQHTRTHMYTNGFNYNVLGRNTYDRGKKLKIKYCYKSLCEYHVTTAVILQNVHIISFWIK